jgi:hypothetical protein
MIGMRKIVVVLVSVMTGLLVASGVALAATISCPNRGEDLCVGTNKKDIMTGRDRADDMRARGGRDIVRAHGGGDELRGGSGEDPLYGQRGADHLVGATGGDTYAFNDDWGNDIITGESSGKDTLDFSAVTRNNLTVNLATSVATSEARVGTNTLNFPSSVVLENVRTGPGPECCSGLSRWSKHPIVLGNRANNRLVGSAGREELYGRGGNDTLLGAATRDSLGGGNGDDLLKGGEGNDSYVYDTDVLYGDTDNWGNDTIVDAPSSDNDGLAPGNGVVFFGLNQALTINLVSSSSGPEVTNASNTGTLNWANNAIDNVSVSGNTSATIKGNPAPNRIYVKSSISNGEGYNFKISTGQGNDSINTDNDLPGDTVDCGENASNTDRDTVYFDAADSVLNCELRYKDPPPSPGD